MTAASPTLRPGRIALYSDPVDPNQAATYGVAEVARMLGVGEQTLRDAIRQGASPVPVIKVMGRYRFAKNAVHAVLSA